ncbi:two-component sensor histidine kinase [Patiriisocius marinistellae]|uniref:histidine kinase n=2 Tax=Patiriisocius marinistellae TaxID=2494560 RepID=A0A5J4FX04_9FLAO|nr:two-component sensor histidine kinase [Patiriisocius marinistellae]
MQQNASVGRIVFLISSVIIISLILWNTFTFFNQLKNNERTKMQIWAAAQQEIASSEVDINANLSETALRVIQGNTTTPMVRYSHSDNEYDSRNIDSLTFNNLKKREKLIAQFTSEYKPLEIKYGGQIIQTIYYGNSPLINKLKYYPAILILILLLLSIAIYYFNQTAKSAEQNKLWAGMAKETAHQIGTPLSSLVGWTEILKSEDVNPEYIEEMDKDIKRLEIITDRFSKVGSMPKLKKTDIVAETHDAYDYLKSRSSKLINFSIKVPTNPIYVNLNSQLFGWTIENLVKNGIDAMKGKGDISVVVEMTGDNALVYVTDTGKGIPKRNHKKIFTPGFTTKKRGWGLGLSLAKRIVEEYHNGKIRVLKSNPKEGTTFLIAIKLSDTI